MPTKCADAKYANVRQSLDYLSFHNAAHARDRIDDDDVPMVSRC